jgi:hypothetical protein
VDDGADHVQDTAPVALGANSVIDMFFTVAIAGWNASQ